MPTNLIEFMADCCVVPLLVWSGLALALCCFGGCGSMSKMANRSNRVSVLDDDERPRKMTVREQEMYNAHMNAYGRTANDLRFQ